MIHFEPSLNELEVNLYGLLNALQMTQAKHQFHDPDAPSFEIPEDLLGNHDAVTAFVEQRRKERFEYIKKRGRIAPRPALNLADLWDMLVQDEEGVAYYGIVIPEPIKKDGQDLHFEDFALSQRRVDESKSPHDWLPRSYFSAVPTGEVAIRCVVKEVTGRCFCTPTQQTNCEVPGPDDFGVVRISGMGINYSTGERKSTVMYVYVPMRYGELQLIKRSDETENERIIGYGEA